MYSKKVLSSGLTIVCEEVPYVRSISLGILIRAGSRYESKNQEGISHFIEHMLFQGTEKLTALNIAEKFDLMGTHVDAFTGKEYTCFYVKMVDTYLPDVLELLSEMLLNSKFKIEDIKKEKDVIFEEIKMYLDTPDEYTLDVFMKNLFDSHPLGHSILGSKETTGNFDRKNIFEYLKIFFSPNNTIISLAGNLKSADIFNLVEKYFGKWEKKEFDFKITSPSFNFENKKEEKEFKQVHVCLGTKGISYNDDDKYSLILLNNILGGSMSSHLFQEVREKRGLAYSVSSFYDCYLDTGIFIVYAATDKQKLNELINIVLQEFKDIKSKGVLEKELHKVKEQIKGNLVLGLENTLNRMIKLLRCEFYREKYLTIEEIIMEVEKITNKDIVGFANKLLPDDKLKLVTVGP
ncbi:MAG: pitrilysin family protein [Candidatus Firestonebacteria bacterium]